MTPHEFYLDTNGRKIDYDGVYENQCVDLIKYFIKIALGAEPGTLCPQTGYAKDMWNSFDKISKLNQNFIRVPANEMKDGDWAIWDSGDNSSCPLSHVAMFRLDNGNGTGIFLSQSKGKLIDQHSISYRGVLGALRPKIYIKKEAPKMINIVCDIPVYFNSGHARDRINVVDHFGKGTYYINAEAIGMYNISQVIGRQDGWINPSENIEPIIVPIETPKPIEEPVIITPPEPQNMPVEEQKPKEEQSQANEPIIEDDKPIQVVEPKLNQFQLVIKLIQEIWKYITKGVRK